MADTEDAQASAPDKAPQDDGDAKNAGSPAKRRQSRLDGLIETRRMSLSAGSLPFTEEMLMEEIEEESEEETENLMTENRLRRISQRVSLYQDKLGRDRLVEVRLRNMSYHVPVRADAPSVKTVWNQTFVYQIYRFFRRVHLYRIWKQTKEAVENVAWNPETSDDIFMPYRKKTILSNINLVLKPGSSYVILGPPGCGKTSLLKAIAGALPGSHTDSLKDKPYFSGRVEYNGLSPEVCNMLLVVHILCVLCSLAASRLFLDFVLSVGSIGAVFT